MPVTVFPSAPMNSLGAYEASEPTVIVPRALIEAGTRAAADEPALGVAAAFAAELDEAELPQALRISALATMTPVIAETRPELKLFLLSLFLMYKDILHLGKNSNSGWYPHSVSGFYDRNRRLTLLNTFFSWNQSE